MSFDEAWSTRVEGDLGERRVNLLGWEALSRNKNASGRDADRLDVKKLQAIAARKPEP